MQVMEAGGRAQTQSRPIKVEPAYFTVQDVQTILGVKERKAQMVIKQLNDELVEKGFMRWPKGRIGKEYFSERYGR